MQLRRIELRPSRLQRDVRPVHQSCEKDGCRGRSRTCSSDVQSVVSVPIRSARQRAVPRGAAPLPPVRQTGVQICYTMAPESPVFGFRISDFPNGPPRGRTSLDGFGDRPGRWTAALEAPCGNRTRIAGLEDRHSAVELKAHEDISRARTGRTFSARALPRLVSGPIVTKLLDPPPGEPDGGGSRKQKNPAPFRARGFDEGSCCDQLMPSPRARAAPSRPGDPTTYSPSRRRPRRTMSGWNGE